MPLRDNESFSEFYERLNRFDGLPQVEQVLRAAWFLQARLEMLRFQPKEITKLFNELNLSPPNIHVNVKRLFERRPRAMMWDKSGYFLEGKCFRALSDELNASVSAVEHITSKALHGLAETLVEPMQRSYLAETMNCYRVGAFRATVVMAWNLAYDHMSRWLMADDERIAEFNASLLTKFPKRSSGVTKLDELAIIKEFDVIETMQHAKIFNKNIADLLKEKLKRRNAAAHPSDVVITQAQADDVITDLIHNVVSKLQIS